MKNYVVTTKKVKCCGIKPGQDFHYFVSITDGINELSFCPLREFDKLSYDNFCTLTNGYGQKLHSDGKSGKLLYLEGWGKNEDIRERTAEAKKLINRLVNTPVKYGDITGTDKYSILTYKISI